MKKLLLFIPFLMSSLLFAQVTTSPSIPSIEGEITIFFDATGTPLEGETGDLYAHTGATVNGEQWQNVIGEWAENAAIGYIPQDNAKYFAEDITMFEWMSQWRSPKHDDLQIKGMLGRLLFTSDDFNKRVQVCSGGEKNRLLFGKLMLEDINVLVMDEPTNHMDMESIEALNNALYKFDGTVIFVSHDREFVSSLATQIIEIKDKQLNHFDGNYEEFLAHKENA